MERPLLSFATHLSFVLNKKKTLTLHCFLSCICGYGTMLFMEFVLSALHIAKWLAHFHFMLLAAPEHLVTMSSLLSYLSSNNLFWLVLKRFCPYFLYVSYGLFKIFFFPFIIFRRIIFLLLKISACFCITCLLYTCSNLHDITLNYPSCYYHRITNHTDGSELPHINSQ